MRVVYQDPYEGGPYKIRLMKVVYYQGPYIMRVVL